MFEAIVDRQIFPNPAPQPAPRRGALARAGIALALVAGLVAGCDTYRGVAEFTAYRDSYTAAADVGTGILDQMAVAERKLHDTANPFDPEEFEFDPKLAAFYTTAVDPPATAANRRTIAAVRTYNDALYGLASGEDAKALVGKVTRLGAIGIGAATDLAALTGAGAGTKIGEALVGVNAVNETLKGLSPLATEIVAFETRSRFRKLLLDQEPKIREAIVASRDRTPEIFNTLRLAVVTGAHGDRSRFGMTDAEKADVRRQRDLMANWVVLLDATMVALDTAVKAVKAEAGAGSFDGLLLTSGNLATAIHQARQNLAGGD